MNLKRLRLPLEAHHSELVLVGDRFEEGGRYVGAEVPLAESAPWTWLDWDDLYDRMARDWACRFGPAEPVPVPAPGAP